MAQIFVQHTHHNPKSTDLTGLDFLVEYDDATAAVSIQEMRSGSFQARQDAYRVAIRRLARAMLAAAQRQPGAVGMLDTPQCIGASVGRSPRQAPIYACSGRWMKPRA